MASDFLLHFGFSQHRPILLSVGSVDLGLDTREDTFTRRTPVLETVHYHVDVFRTRVPAYGVVHLQLTVLLVQFSVNYVGVDRFDYQIFQITHIRDA